MKERKEEREGGVEAQEKRKRASSAAHGSDDCRWHPVASVRCVRHRPGVLPLSFLVFIMDPKGGISALRKTAGA